MMLRGLVLRRRRRGRAGAEDRGRRRLRRGGHHTGLILRLILRLRHVRRWLIGGRRWAGRAGLIIRNTALCTRLIARRRR